MIVELKGLIKKKEIQKIYIEVHDITYVCLMPHTIEIEENKVINLLIRFIWNSESGPCLYAFLQEEERSFFDLLINCNGVGPKYALNILGHFSLSILVGIIKEKNIKMLSEVSGIGKKKAELIILELGDKIDRFKISNQSSSSINELSSIFKQLGYNQAENNKLIELYNLDSSLKDLETGEVLRILLSKMF